MLPEAMMDDEEELRLWIGRAFKFAASQPPKAQKPKKTAKRPAKKRSNAIDENAHRWARRVPV
jgi:hypothetical protein